MTMMMFSLLMTFLTIRNNNTRFHPLNTFRFFLQDDSFSREWAKRRKRAYQDFSLISASSRRALWIPRGTTRGGLRCVMMYALLMFYYYVKKSFFLFRSLSLLSVSPFSLKWCVFCIAAVIIAPFFSSLSPSSLSFFNSFSRRAMYDAYYYLLLNLTLVRVFLLNLWR